MYRKESWIPDASILIVVQVPQVFTNSIYRGRSGLFSEIAQFGVTSDFVEFRIILAEVFSQGVSAFSAKCAALGARVGR
jgi:hypothetical protein